MSDGLQILWENDGSMQILESPFFKIHFRNSQGSWKELPGFNPGEMGEINSIGLYGNYYLIQATNPELHYFVASRKSGKVTHCAAMVEATAGPDITGMLNDLDGGLFFWPKAKIGNKIMVCLFDAPVLMDYAKGNMSVYGGQATEISQKFKDMASKLTYEDNPVVALVMVK